MVYLLHFSAPYHHARHYLGSSADVGRRLARHRRGQGGRLIQVIIEAGLTFELVRTWPGGKTEERRLKDRHEGPRLCPICRKERVRS